MNKNTKNFKQLPRGIKFATINSHDEEDIILEETIATLIYNGYSSNEIYKSIFDTENREASRFIGHIAEDIMINFIKLNPEFDAILEKNNRIYNFSNNHDIGQ